MTSLQVLSTLLTLYLSQGVLPAAETPDAPRTEMSSVPVEAESAAIEPRAFRTGFPLDELLEDFDVKDCTTGNSGGPCFALTTAHTGQGSDPSFFPCGNIRPMVPCPGPNEFYGGALVFLDALPASGWHVGGWVNADFPSSTDKQNQVTMPTDDVTVTVNYVQCFTLSTAHTPDEGGGDPTTNPARSTPCPSDGEYVAGETVRLKAQPASGWLVSGWRNTDNDQSTSVTNSVTMTNASRTVTVEYDRPCFELDRRHFPPEGGADPTAVPTGSDSCSSSNQYVVGEQLQLTAAPAAGWEMERWKGTDDDESTSTTNTLVMPGKRHQVLAVYTRPVFDSGFEEEGFCDWSTRFCDSCDRFACHLEAGAVSVPLDSYRTLVSGEHVGVLLGPEDADFDLALQWWNGSDWVPVASRLSPTSAEEVIYEGEPGLYRWLVTSAAGAGEYDLAIAYPGLAGAAANQLDQVRKPRKEKKRSLRATLDRDSKDRDYLVNSSPRASGGQTHYEASFWIRPDKELFVKGKKHQVFQLQQVTGVAKPRAVVEVLLKAVRGGQNRYGVYARVRTDAAGKPKTPVLAFSGGEWTPIRIVWRAASGAGSSDGRLELHVGDEDERILDLPNSSDRVEQALLGLISRGSKKTNGLLYFDDFRSSWED